MRKIFNRTAQKAGRQALRHEMTRAEKILWYYLKKRFLGGYKFRRQYGVDSYIVDFYCPVAKLAIEIDGDSHYKPGAQKKDAHRQRDIEALGIRVLRFTNIDIQESLDGVIKIIKQYLHTPPLTPPQ